MNLTHCILIVSIPRLFNQISHFHFTVLNFIAMSIHFDSIPIINMFECPANSNFFF